MREVQFAHGWASRATRPPWVGSSRTPPHLRCSGSGRRSQRAGCDHLKWPRSGRCSPKRRSAGPTTCAFVHPTARRVVAKLSVVARPPTMWVCGVQRGFGVVEHPPGVAHRLLQRRAPAGWGVGVGWEGIGRELRSTPTRWVVGVHPDWPGALIADPSPKVVTRGCGSRTFPLAGGDEKVRPGSTPSTAFPLADAAPYAACRR